MDWFSGYLMPVLSANLVHHFLVIRYNLMPQLAIPVDFGQSLSGKRIFGDSKTLRGFITISALTGGFTLLLTLITGNDFGMQLPPFWTGTIIGLAYSLGELPTSFLKRRAGIKPSGQATGIKGLGFYVMEQTDSALYAAIAAGITGQLDAGQTAGLFAAGTGLHIFIDVCLYIVGYKKSLTQPEIFRKLPVPKHWQPRG